MIPNLEALTQETVGLLADQILKGMNDGSLKKTIDVSTGLQGINLEAPAKQLVPLLSPFRQSIPRRVAGTPGTAVQWKAITAISSPKLSVAERAAGSLPTMTVVPKTAAYKSTALRGEVTWEAEVQSKGFDPALAKETANNLLNYMKLEEIQILGGNVSALSTPGAPTLSEQNGLGSLPADQYFVRIAAMTLPAAMRVSIDRPADYNGTNAFLDGRAVAAFDVESDGCTVAGTEANITTTGGSDAIKITWSPVNGAAAYGVFVGLATGAANLKCEAIVSQCNVTLKSLAGTGVAGDHAGSSADALSYDGIIPQLFAAGSGAYIKNVAGVLTGSGGEIVEIQDAFQYLWDNAKIGDFRMLVSGQDSRILTRLGVSQNALRVMIQANGQQPGSTLTQGFKVTDITNAVAPGSGSVPVEVLPWLPGGMVIILPKTIPYPSANVDAPVDMHFAQDVGRFDYAASTSDGPIFPFEIRARGACRVVFPGGCAVLHNIVKG